MTHTYVIIELSRSAANEIAAKMRAAGYEHAFHDEGERGIVIDMHGIAIATDVWRPDCGSPLTRPRAYQRCNREAGHDGPHRHTCGA